MTDQVQLPEAEYIVEIFETLYEGSSLATQLAPHFMLHSGKVFDANGVAGVIFEACCNIEVLMAHSEDPIEVGDYEIIALALCQGAGKEFIQRVVRIIGEMEVLRSMFRAPSAKDH